MHCVTIRNLLFVVTDFQTIIVCQLPEKTLDRANDVPLHIYQRELPIAKNAVAACHVSNDTLLTLHRNGSLHCSVSFTKEEIDKNQGMAISLDYIQQGIRRFFSQIEELQSLQEINQAAVRNINDDIEALNVAIHILFSIKREINLETSIRVMDNNSYYSKNIRQIEVSIKNKSNFRLTKYWNLLVTVNDRSQSKEFNETFSFPVDDIMIDTEWKQVISKVLRSYDPIQIEIHLCFKMPNHDKGFGILLSKKTLNCWDFITPWSKSLSILNEESNIQTVEDRMHLLLLTTVPEVSNAAKIIQILKFQFTIPMECDLKAIHLHETSQMKYLTHMGDVVSIQLRQIMNHPQQETVFEATLHSRNQHTLLFVKQAILTHILKLRKETQQANHSTESYLQLSEIMSTFREQLLELQDLIDQAHREERNGNVTTVLRNINQLYEKLIAIYSKMRQHSVL
jgi:hypothetical protein